MTYRQFCEFVVANVDNAEVVEIAQKWLDKENAKKSGKAEADAVLRQSILDALGIAGNPVTASEIGAEVGLSTAKTASLLKGMRADGTVKANEEIKGGKVIRTYTLA